MPAGESADLIDLARAIADKELRPAVSEAERTGAFLALLRGVRRRAAV
jgi:hypothetical protein